MQFQSLNIIDPILKAIKEEEYETPTPIQELRVAVPLHHCRLHYLWFTSI